MSTPQARCQKGRWFSGIPAAVPPDYFLRCRIFARMRRFLRPSLRRPLPDFLVPTLFSAGYQCSPLASYGVCSHELGPEASANTYLNIDCNSAARTNRPLTAAKFPPLPAHRFADSLLNQHQQGIGIIRLANVVATAGGPRTADNIRPHHPADDDHGNIEGLRIVEYLAADR